METDDSIQEKTLEGISEPFTIKSGRGFCKFPQVHHNNKMDMLIHVSIHVNISRLVCIRLNRYMSLANDYC